MAQVCIYGGRECNGCMNCSEERDAVAYEDWLIEDDGLEENT